MLITSTTQTKTLGAPIRATLVEATTNLLERWKNRTTRLNYLLSNFQFNFEAVPTRLVVTSDNYCTERDYWKTSFLTPLLKQYRSHLAQHSREDEGNKLDWIDNIMVRSFATLTCWERKVTDIFNTAKTLAHRVNAKTNVHLIRRILTRAGEVSFTDAEARRWHDLLTPPTNEDAVTDWKEFAKALDEELKNRGTKQAHYWKKVVAAIDLWVGPRGWFIPLKLSDLELILEELDSVKDE